MFLPATMMATEKLRARQESTDSLENSGTLEEYSDDDKDLALEDFKFIKTIGELRAITWMNKWLVDYRREGPVILLLWVVLAPGGDVEWV